jgi:hypothetical protein
MTIADNTMSRGKTDVYGEREKEETRSGQQ